jgi:BirA family biotin operon repressor/biotin-[acetyl-CoA-carboxylase] ligase
LGAQIEILAETGSTNADLAARLRSGERIAEGFWLLADRQSAGRGRQGREWFDGAGNFMGSTVVRPAPGDPLAPSLAFVAGLAVWEAVSHTMAEPAGLMLKWPNDLLLGGAKLAGILLEGVDDAVVVGIGANLTSAPELPDRPTMALSALGPAPDRDSFAAMLAQAFAAECERWRRYGLEPLLARWQSVAHPAGAPLTVQEPGASPMQGTFAGLAADGALQLRLEDGSIRVVHAGDVFA